MPLSATGVKNARPKDKPYRLSDEKGLYLIVRPNGAKWWRFDYRVAGVRKTLSFGVFPDVGLADARQARDDARSLVARGTDPSEVRKVSQPGRDISFETIARQWHGAKIAGWTPRYAETVLNRLEANIFPAFGSRQVDEIDSSVVLAALRPIEERGAVEAARRIKNYCSEVFAYSIALGLAKLDPTTTLSKILKSKPPTKRHAAMKASELPGFLARLADFDGEEITQLAIRLTVLTMVRTTETRFARWDEFEGLDGPSALWRIPAERMKMRSEHLVPLSPQAVAVVARIREVQSDHKLLFARKTVSGVLSENSMLFALARMGYHKRATIHGFRGTASTWLNEHGWNRDWVERQLAHTERDEVRGAYNAAEYLPGRRKMLLAWADHLDICEQEGRIIG